MKSWQRQLAAFAAPFRVGLAGVLLIGCAGIALEILKPWPLKLAVDYLLPGVAFPPAAAWIESLPGATSRNGVLAWLAAGTVQLFLAAWFAKLAQNYIQTGLGNRMTYRLAGSLLDHLQRLSLAYHQRAGTGDLIKRVTSDAGCVRDLWISTALPAALSSLLLVAMFFVMWRLDPLLTLLALVVVPLHVITIRGFGGSLMDRSYEEMAAQGEMMSAAERSLSALPVVQAYGQETREEMRFAEAARRSGQAYLKSVITQTQFGFSVGAASAIGRAAMLGVSGGFVLGGRISIGDMLIFMSYLLALYSPVETLASLASSYARASAGAKRVFEVLDTTPAIADTPGSRDLILSPSGAHPRMRFEKVAFRYTPEQPVLTNVSFAAAAGETVAIVGESGAGKSTLVRLLLRFEDPEHGRILLDGQDVRDVTLHSLRSQIAVVLQNPFLLPISVAANIAYGHPGASEDDIRTAARAACAHEFIERLPEGYDTILGEHTSLSGGEQQRLAIARAILANAPIVILDEPTASLDAETEESLMLALDHLCEGRTVLMIAHRQATIRRADRVITIRGGQLLDEVLA